MIRVSGLSKKIGKVRALTGIDLEVRAGEALAVAGTNGSGRSTLLKVLATLLPPTTGEIVIDGIDARRDPLAVRRLVGYLDQAPGLPARLRLGDHLEFVAAARGVPAAARAAAVAVALASSGLSPRAWIRDLSPGQRQESAVVSALLGEPRLLLLDEPTTHLDPLARGRISALMSERRKAGATILVACADVRDSSFPCDRIAFLHRGRLLAVAERSRDGAGSTAEILKTLLDARGENPREE